MVVEMKVRPWHGKWVSRSKANRLNDMFATAKPFNRENLHKEAIEYKQQMLKLRSETISKGLQW